LAQWSKASTRRPRSWQNGDLIVFDNLLMQHARGNVLPDGPARTLRKVIAPVAGLQAEKPRFSKAG
jgi:taurine dioxygenase